MSDQNIIETPAAINEITPELKKALNETKAKLKGSDRRKFMARIVSLLGPGGQLRAERELGWDRKTIRKGMKELESGFNCVDNFSARGRKRVEEHLPSLVNDIIAIMTPASQTDPTFQTTKLYSPLTAKELRRRLIEDMHYADDVLPTERTLRTKLNELNFHPQKVDKCKPKKKIPETDAIFDNVHKVNKLADETEGVVRLSCDAKATINIGPFSRGGYSRQGNKASDHDFEPESVMKPFGIFLPAYDESYLYFTENNITADFMVDSIEDLWPMLQSRFNAHTLEINLDNGPENNSSRSQFIKRLVDFAIDKEVNIGLTYYPPYHSKYNPIERVWGILENHWNGEILDSKEKVLGLAGTMTYNGKNPVVKLVQGIYEKGVKLTKKIKEKYEALIDRMPGLEKWSVDIPCYADQ